MKISVYPARTLPAEVIAAWRELQPLNPHLASPYFAPGFTAAVASARSDVHVAVMSESGTISGLFPFQRSGRVGAPVGGLISDYQGLVCRPGFGVEAENLLKACDVDVFDFDHMVMSDGAFAAHAAGTQVSPQIDLSEGYDRYVEGRRAAGSEQIKKCDNLARRIEREVGPLRFVAHSPDPSHLRTVMGWKSEQYLRTGKLDILAQQWIRDALAAIQAIAEDDLRGALSLLYAGDELIAGHMGMRGPGVWHYWFPAYDERYALYSPGLLLLLRMAQAGASEGVHTIDLGKGMSLYKERLMNTQVELGHGSVERPSMTAMGRRMRSAMRSAVLRTPLAGPVRRLAHSLKRA